MGVDITFDATHQIRRALTLLSILEKTDGGYLRSKELRVELQRYENSDSLPGNDVISDFVNLVTEWEEEAKGIKILGSAETHDQNDNIVPRSPYKFKLDRSSYPGNVLYNDYLRIAFALLLVKTGNLNFIDHLRQNEHPLSILMTLLNSIGKNKVRRISIEYRNLDNEIISENFQINSLTFNSETSQWIIKGENQINNEISIPILSIISVSLIDQQM